MGLPDWSDSNLQAAAPFLDQWSDAYSLPREVVYGIASQESRFQASATGAAGEIGIMQIKPSTSAALGFTSDPTQLYDLSTNIEAGVAYLAQQWQKYGDVTDTVSAYNAGRPISGNAAYVNGVLTRAAYFAEQFGDSDAGDLTAAAASEGTGSILGVPLAIALGGVGLLLWYLA